VFAFAPFLEVQHGVDVLLGGFVPKQWDHGLRRQVLVESLLEEIVNGRIRSGEHLVTQALARRFGVSHTPVREALVMLAGMGLLDVMPNRGAIVRKVTARGVREICQVRSALESVGLPRCGRSHRMISRKARRTNRFSDRQREATRMNLPGSSPFLSSQVRV